MKNNKNIKGKKLNQLIKSNNFKPSKYTVLITVNTYEPKNNLDIVSSETLLDDWQYVIAVGDGCLYKPGDKIFLNSRKMSKTMIDPEDRNKTITRLDIDPFLIDDVTLSLIPESYIFGKEEINKSSDIHLSNSMKV